MFFQAEITKRSLAKPFRKFKIVTSSGQEYKIPRAISLTITRLHKTIVVEHENGTMVHIDPEQVAAVI